MNCVHRQWFSEVFLSSCNDSLQNRVVFIAVPPKGPEITAIQCWFSALSLAYRDFSGFSLMILCIVEDEIYNIIFSFTTRNIILYPQSLSQGGEVLSVFMLRDSACFTWFANHHILFFFTVYTVSQLFWKGTVFQSESESELYLLAKYVNKHIQGTWFRQMVSLTHNSI